MPSLGNSANLTSSTAQSIADRIVRLIGNSKFEIRDSSGPYTELGLMYPGVYVTSKGQETSLNINTSVGHWKITVGKSNSWARLKFSRDKVEITMPNDEKLLILVTKSS